MSENTDTDTDTVGIQKYRYRYRYRHLKIPTKIPNTDTDSKYRYRPMTSQHIKTQIFMGWMLLMTSNQQRQSTEATIASIIR